LGSFRDLSIYRDIQRKATLFYDMFCSHLLTWTCFGINHLHLSIVIKTNVLMCLPKLGGARDNNFLVAHPMTDQRCLVSAITRRAHGRTASSFSESIVCAYNSSKIKIMAKKNIVLVTTELIGYVPNTLYG
jgi:hypothetical protein